MGDRGNIVIRQGKTSADDVWFYTHWRGHGIGQVVQESLALRERWTDASYLARIVFCRLVRGQEEETVSFGISTSISDNEHDIVVVDVPNQRVYSVKEKELTGDGRLCLDYEPKKSCSFEELAALKPQPQEA